MIEKMKKLTFLVYHREYEEFLHRLQELGVMHIEGGALAEGQSDAVSADMAELRRVDALLKQMENLPTDKKSAEPQAPDATSVDCTLSSDSIATLESLFARQADLASREKELAEQVETLTPWGEFDPNEVNKQMAAAGCEMHFYTASTKAFKKEIAPNFPVEAINEVKGLTYFVAITRGEEQDIPATAVTLPEASLSALRAEHESINAQLATLNAQLSTTSTAQRADLEAYREQLQSRMNFDTVRFGTETAADDHLMVLRGWIPAKDKDKMQAAFADSGAWFEIADPQPDDDIPVCLKNNRFFKLFEMFT